MFERQRHKTGGSARQSYPGIALVLATLGAPTALTGLLVPRRGIVVGHGKSGSWCELRRAIGRAGQDDTPGLPRIPYGHARHECRDLNPGYGTIATVVRHEGFDNLASSFADRGCSHALVYRSIVGRCSGRRKRRGKA
jgi:hypothetical protein